MVYDTPWNHGFFSRMRKQWIPGHFSLLPRGLGTRLLPAILHTATGNIVACLCGWIQVPLPATIAVLNYGFIRATVSWCFNTASAIQYLQHPAQSRYSTSDVTCQQRKLVNLDLDKLVLRCFTWHQEPPEVSLLLRTCLFWTCQKLVIILATWLYLR